ncbi:MAG: ABC transporter ATP-binding protein [Asticcacaulis sp.]
MPVLRFDKVTKTFGDFTAVDGLSFEVAEGQIFGFLGGNGAGKTTSLRMALDIFRPDTGTIEVLGQAPGRANAARIGFLPEERGLYRDMSAIDTIVYFGQLKHMSATRARDAGMNLLARFEIADWAKTHVDKLSKGMAQKVQLAAALVNAPRLLILDEPFSGLDPVNQALLESVIIEARQGGATVVFSTHVMQHAERLCDRLLMLSHGKKVFDGTQDEARASLPQSLRITARLDPSALPGVGSAKPSGGSDGGWTEWDIVLAPGTQAGDLLQYCTEHSFALRGFAQRQVSLHDVFLHHVGGSHEGASK